MIKRISKTLKPVPSETCQMNRVLAKCPEDRGSIPSLVIPKTQKMVFDDSLICTQHYKIGARLPDDPLRWNFSRRVPTRDLS